MLTRSAVKRSRERKEDAQVLSLRVARRRKLTHTTPPSVWNKSLFFHGPISLHKYLAREPVIVDEFVEQCIEIVSLTRETLICGAPKNTPFLPPKLRSLRGRKTLVLDIDETLVHSVVELDPTERYDATFVVDSAGTQKTVGMKKRPYVEEFLAWCGAHFEVVTFTSAIKSYADYVLNMLDPTGEHVKHRLYREHCTICNREIYFKGLEYLRRDLSQTMIVDNSPFAFACHLENGVPIQSFYGGEDGKDDTELLRLKNFLEKVLEVDDVRQAIKSQFGMRDFLRFLDSKVGRRT